MCVGVGFTKSPFMDPQVVDESLKTKTRLFSAALGFGKTPNSTGGSLVGKPGGAVHKGKFTACTTIDSEKQGFLHQLPG